MTHSEKIYMEARERLLNAPDTIVDEDFIAEVIQDTYPEMSFIEQDSLAGEIHIPSLVEDVKEQLAEEESNDRDPLAHVGMRMGDFI